MPSADVQMHMMVDGNRLSIGQLGPDFVILDLSIDHPPTIARLFLSIDGHAKEWDVLLPDGISAQSPRVAIATPA